MSLTESIAEDAALEWIAEQSRVAPTLNSAFSQREKEQGSEVLIVGRLREANRRLNPSIPCRTFATLLPKPPSGELSVVEL